MSEDERRIVALWGDDPVHPTNATYRELAAKISDKVEQLLEEKMKPEYNQESKKKKPKNRNPRISGSQSVAKRLDTR